jgi:transposase
MRVYSEVTAEKAMTRQEVILRAYAKKISWIQAAEILGISVRHLRRIKQAYEERGFHALFDGRVGKASPRRAAAKESKPTALTAITKDLSAMRRTENFRFVTTATKNRTMNGWRRIKSDAPRRNNSESARKSRLTGSGNGIRQKFWT